MFNLCRFITAGYFILVMAFIPAYSAETKVTNTILTSYSGAGNYMHQEASGRSMVKGHIQKLEGKYLLAPGDTINMSVYEAQEFDQNNLVIRPDGFLTIKPFGEMEVAGMDIESLTGEIEEKFRSYLKTPHVSISVIKFHPAIVYVLGAVHRPGAYEIHGDIENPDSSSDLLIRGRLTVSNLIANAGGITQNANVRQIIIKNRETSEDQVVDLIKLLRDGDTAQDIMVRSGDTVFVSALSGQEQIEDETFKLLSQSTLSPGTFTVRVLGKVASPGVYNISAQSPGINSAIASAKGYMIEASQHEVKVLRMDSQGSLAVKNVDPLKKDFILRDNDIVVVDERSIPIAGRGWDYAERIIRPFLGMGNFANTILDIFNPERRFPFGNR